MTAQILNGRWTRKVTWEQKGMWRTDIFKTTLADPRLQEAEFVLQDGQRVIIPAEELRRVLIWGPFNIDPANHTVDGQRVQMEVVG